MTNLKRNISSVFLVLLIAAGAEFLTSVILGRNLSPDIFGRFKFINTIVLLLSTLLLFGQNIVIIRVLSKENIVFYNWRKFIYTCLFFSSLVGITITLFIGYYYQFGKEMVFIYLVFFTMIGIECLSSLFRAQGKYTYSIILSKSNSFGFFLAVCGLFYIAKNDDFYLLLSMFVLASMVSFLVAVVHAEKIPNGKSIFPRSTIKEGIWLFLITSSYMILVYIDQFFIVKMLGYKELAGYVVILTVTRGYDLINYALLFVLTPTYAKAEPRSIKKDSYKVTFIGGLISLVYLIFGGWLVHFLFKGKYDQAIYLVNFFIIIGFLKTLYAIPSGIISGKLSVPYLKKFLVLSLFGILLNIAGQLSLIPWLGLTGAVIATMVSWLYRVVTAYYVVYKGAIDQHTI
jgi:O-antigen/teichoic acid export membrane protein